MKQFQIRVRNFVRILQEPRSVWIGILVTIFWYYAPLIWFSWVDMHAVNQSYIVRIYGAVLQIFGILTIFWELSARHKIFASEGFLSVSFGWFRRLFTALYRRPEKRVGAGSSTIRPPTSSGRATVHPSQDASLDEKVRDLQKKYDKLFNDMGKMETSLQRRIESTVQHESDERKKADQVIHDSLRGAAIGGIHIEVSGIIFLAFGVLCGTIPEIVMHIMPYTHSI